MLKCEHEPSQIRHLQERLRDAEANATEGERRAADLQEALETLTRERGPPAPTAATRQEVDPRMLSSATSPPLPPPPPGGPPHCTVEGKIAERKECARLEAFIIR